MIDIATGVIAAASVVVIELIVVLGGRCRMLLSDTMRSRDAIWSMSANMPPKSMAALDGDVDDDVDVAVSRAKVANELVGVGAPELEVVTSSSCALQDIAVSRLLLILKLSGMQRVAPLLRHVLQVPVCIESSGRQDIQTERGSFQLIICCKLMYLTTFI